MYKINRWVDIENSKYDNIWHNSSRNPNAIQLLEANPEKINWHHLSYNPYAIHLIEQNLDYDYEALTERCNIYKEELIKKTMHPSKIQKYLDMGISIDELDNHL